MTWKIGNNLYSERLQMFNPRDLHLADIQDEIQKYKYHIYLVCKRKKLIFNNCDTKNKDYNESHFYKLDNEHNKVFISIKHSKDLTLNHKNGNYINSTYKGENFDIRDFLIVSALFHLEDDKIGSSISELLPSDLEVMYVGQAFGRDQERKIDYRISKHEKIKDISLEILDKSSNEEVLVIGCSINNNSLATLFSSLSSRKDPVTAESLLKLRQSASQEISEGQEITLYEASLINYFQPPYNKIYKEDFPTPDYKSYDEIYSTDFNYINITIDTWCVATRIYSSIQNTPKYVHSQHFALSNNIEKKSLFDFLFAS